MYVGYTDSQEELIQNHEEQAANSAFAWEFQYPGIPVPNIVTDVTEPYFGVQIIFGGSIRYDSESEDHRQLLNRGMVTVEESQDEGEQQHPRLIIAAPLLASAALRMHREPLPSSSIEPLTIGQAKDAW